MFFFFNYYYFFLFLGISEIFPIQLLSLCSWQYLEQRVCGKPYIDLDLLKRHTEYSNVSADAAHIKFFWQVLEEWNQEDLRKFIKFAWAQERLPSSDEGFQRGSHKVRMLIKNVVLDNKQNPDHRFPKADTCFFNLELPPYSSVKIMREKLNIVINMSGAIDADDRQDVENDFGVPVI